MYVEPNKVFYAMKSSTARRLRIAVYEHECGYFGPYDVL